ncbi:MAG: hypothetical protein ACK57G_08865, partial [Planctomycetota bacterium]
MHETLATMMQSRRLTNALVAATCVNESFKLLTQCGRAQDYVLLDQDGCIERGYQIFEYHG